MKQLFFLSLLTLSAADMSAQDRPTKKFDSINSVLDELLDQISIEKGEKIDTAAVRELFHPNAQLAILNHGDSTFVRTISLKKFLPILSSSVYEKGFSEKEIRKVVHEFNGIAQVFQSFAAEGAEGYAARGINSYQLVFYDNQWKILYLLWTNESDSTQLPGEYLTD